MTTPARRPDTGDSPGLLAAALAYGARGWRVMPLYSAVADGRCDCRDRACSSPSKHPRTMHGLRDATTDEAAIRRWWRLWPDAGIGIATGGGLAVVDVDPRHGGDATLAAWEDVHGEVRTLTCRTGGGGLHLYLVADLRSRAGVAPGIDTRGGGGYVVAPPSLHISGRRYEWCPDLPEFPQAAPAWLLELLAAARSQAAVAPAADAELRIPDGDRDTTLAALAGGLRRRGLGEAAILAALRGISDHHCDPPHEDEDLRRIAHSIARYSPGATPACTCRLGARADATTTTAAAWNGGYRPRQRARA